MGAREINIQIGRKFNSLTLESHKIVGKYRIGQFLCACGNRVSRNYSHVKSGFTTSCGCAHSEMLMKRNITHGLEHHPLTKIYRAIKARCYNSNSSSYSRYGGRGVRMRKIWLNNFMAFFNWCIDNGWKPGLQLDKDIKGNGLWYGPNSCCIVSRKQNCRARDNTIRLTYKGSNKPLVEWCEELNLNAGTIRYRLHRGWSVKKSLETPIKKQKS